MLLTGPMGDLDTTNAACKGLHVVPGTERDRFFPERGTAQITARDAKTVCNGEDGVPACPILSECLEYALGRKERFGIWGGKSERERARIAKQRRVEVRRRELEAEQQVQARRDRALKAWETRRRRALEQEQAVLEAANRSKETRGPSIVRRRRPRAAA